MADNVPLSDAQYEEFSEEWERQEYYRIRARSRAQSRHDATSRPQATASRTVGGGDFCSEEDVDSPAIWGSGPSILWSKGEGMMIAGHQGLGKTTIAQQLMLYRTGIRKGLLLDMPVEEGTGRCVYLAMDRPRQAARSLRRMVTEDEYPLLNERIVVWKGPLPVNVLSSPPVFADFLLKICPDVSTVFINSVEDLAPGLSDDPVGSGINLAWQEVIAQEIELLPLHHQRKAASGQERGNELDDIYGSTWITSGMGSIFCLAGEPGAVEVEMIHRKFPSEPVTGLMLEHNHSAGTIRRVKAEITVLDVLTGRVHVQPGTSR